MSVGFHVNAMKHSRVTEHHAQVSQTLTSVVKETTAVISNNCSFSSHYEMTHVCLSVRYFFYFHTELNCSNIETPQNGWKSTDVSFVYTFVSFQCNSGYVMSGKSALQCLINETWNGTAPVCKGSQKCTTFGQRIFDI